ncbi:MAG: RDD family protein [Rhodanobacter sp.]
MSLVWMVPLMWGFVLGIKSKRGFEMSTSIGVLFTVGALVLLAMFVVNGVLIHRHGQTIGKRVLDMSMVRTHGDRMGLVRYIFLRVLPVSLLGVIPFVGRFAWLVDALLIFGAERRCLHDLIADTIVIDV